MYSEQTTLPLENLPFGCVSQPSEKNVKLFASLNFCSSYISNVNIGTNIQTDGEGLKGSIIFLNCPDCLMFDVNNVI